MFRSINQYCVLHNACHELLFYVFGDFYVWDTGRRGNKTKSLLILMDGYYLSYMFSDNVKCTFPESNCGDPPALIQELSHPAMAFPELQGEKILSISCSEFFTSVMTESGKVFWW